MPASLLLCGTLLAAATSPLPSPTRPPAGDAATVVARIGDEVLSREMLDAYYDALPPSRRAVFARTGGKRAFLEELIDQKLVVAEAVGRGYLARPAIRAAAELARDAVLYRAWVDAEVTAKIATEAVKKRWYSDHQERFAVPESLDLRAIVVTPHREQLLRNESGNDAVGEAAAGAKIERLRKAVAAGADFAALARRESEDAAAPRGGLLEGVTRDRLAKPLEDAAFALKPGEVSGVITTPGGLHLLKLETRHPPHVKPYAEVDREVEAAVIAEHKTEMRPLHEELVRKLRAAQRVEIVNTALPPPPLASPEPPPSPRSAP